LLKQGEAGQTVAIVEVSRIERPCGSSSRCMRVSTPPYFGFCVCAKSAAGAASRPSARSIAVVVDRHQVMRDSSSPPSLPAV